MSDRIVKLESVAFACHSAACRPPTSGGTGGSSGSKGGGGRRSSGGGSSSSGSSSADSGSWPRASKGVTRKTYPDGTSVSIHKQKNGFSVKVKPKGGKLEEGRFISGSGSAALNKAKAVADKLGTSKRSRDAVRGEGDFRPGDD